MKVLNVMLSDDAQNRIIYDGQDLLSYSQDVDIRLTEYLKDVKSVVEENHMYIRIASNDFFAVSKDVVSKMISGEYDAEQAYQSFNAQLLEEESTSENPVFDSQNAYSNRFHSSGGNAAVFCDGEHSARHLRDGCADRNGKQLYGKRIEGRVYRKNGGRHDYAKRSFGLQLQDERSEAERGGQKLCRRLPGRLHSV